MIHNLIHVLNRLPTGREFDSNYYNIIEYGESSTECNYYGLNYCRSESNLPIYFDLKCLTRPDIFPASASNMWYLFYDPIGISKSCKKYWIVIQLKQLLCQHFILNYSLEMIYSRGPEHYKFLQKGHTNKDKT